MGLLIGKNKGKKGKTSLRIADGQIIVRGKYSVKILTKEEVERERVQVYSYAL